MTNSTGPLNQMIDSAARLPLIYKLLASDKTKMEKSTPHRLIRNAEHFICEQASEDL